MLGQLSWHKLIIRVSATFIIALQRIAAIRYYKETKMNVLQNELFKQKLNGNFFGSQTVTASVLEMVKLETSSDISILSDFNVQ